MLKNHEQACAITHNEIESVLKRQSMVAGTQHKLDNIQIAVEK
jgi:hypothetical protein